MNKINKKRMLRTLATIRALIEQGPEVDEIISNLLKACISLMDEVCQKRATDWDIVNDAMVAGKRYLKNREARVVVKKSTDE